jgi:hypothetical protein
MIKTEKPSNPIEKKQKIKNYMPQSFYSVIFFLSLYKGKQTKTF